MARFTDLVEQDRIQYIKDGFVLILEQLAKDPSKLSNYIKLEKPKLTVAAFEPIKETMSDGDKQLANERNAILKAKVDAENEKLISEYNVKEGIYKRIEEIVSKLPKQEHCVCTPPCIDTSIVNGRVPAELEILIDAARKEAEDRNY